MSSWANKTSHEPPPRDRRKIDQEPAKVPPHKKPRTYLLHVKTVTTWTSSEWFKFPSRAAREQAKRDHQRKADQYSRAGAIARFVGRKTVEMEESEE